jgi:hypothetical protein
VMARMLMKFLSAMLATVYLHTLPLVLVLSPKSGGLLAVLFSPNNQLL